MIFLIAEKRQVKRPVRETSHKLSTHFEHQRDAFNKKPQEMADQSHLSEAEGDKNGTLLATESYAVWILNGKDWIQQCTMPDDCDDVCFCSVSDGLAAIRGSKHGNRKDSLCYHYSLVTKSWKKLQVLKMSAMYRSTAAVEIQNMVVLAMEGTSGHVYEVDIKQDKVCSLTPIPWCFEELHVAATNGHCFFMGDEGNQSYFELYYKIFEYHRGTGLCTEIQMRPGLNRHPFSQLCTCYAFTAVADKLYVLGASNCVYDLKTQQETNLGVAPRLEYIYGVCMKCCAVVRGKSILLCGGFKHDHSGGYLSLDHTNAIEEYNTITQQWKMFDISLPFTFGHWSFVASISV